jgi:PAP2 superfamily
VTDCGVDTVAGGGERPRAAVTTTARGWRRQVIVFAAAYAVYEVARWLTTGSTSAAMANASRIVRLEADFGLDFEGGVQNALVDLPVMAVLNYVYLAAQLAVVPLTLIWLYRRCYRIYLALRNTVLATWLISVPIYALYPVAPPRLANIGLVDTVTDHAGVALDSNFTTIFYNAFAAVPSLHVGFAFAVGTAVALVGSRRTTRALAIAWGPLVTLTVVATGNHFIFDAVAGVLVTALGFFVGTLALRLERRRTTADVALSEVAA